LILYISGSFPSSPSSITRSMKTSRFLKGINGANRCCSDRLDADV
jgi:hypothetical protein